MDLILNLVRQILQGASDEPALQDVSHGPTTRRKSNRGEEKPSGKRRADVLLMQVRQPLRRETRLKSIPSLMFAHTHDT